MLMLERRRSKLVQKCSSSSWFWRLPYCSNFSVFEWFSMLRLLNSAIYFFSILFSDSISLHRFETSFCICTVISFLRSSIILLKVLVYFSSCSLNFELKYSFSSSNLSSLLLIIITLRHQVNKAMKPCFILFYSTWNKVVIDFFPVWFIINGLNDRF